MFACEHDAVSPDFLCVAKGLTGGYLPLAATLTTEEVFSAFLGEPQEAKTFFHGHTYTGNPLCCAAAIASLELFAKDRVLEQLGPRLPTLARASTIGSSPSYMSQTSASVASWSGSSSCGTLPDIFPTTRPNTSGRGSSWKHEHDT